MVVEVMAEIRLAYTSSGVEPVALIDQDALDSLATWLCADRCFHDAVDRHKCEENCFLCNRHERQVKKQGYCDLCRNFAGELLSHFDLVKKEAAQ